MNEYRADDLAVAGVSETLVALSNGQVEEMLITASANDLKYDEAEAKKVLQAYGADDQESFDNRAIADELVRRATETSSARITFIEDTSLLEPIGGVGVFIRYRISEERAAPYEQADAVAKSEALTEA
jgi:peptide subunit release factor 1 (eRF1)